MFRQQIRLIKFSKPLGTGLFRYSVRFIADSLPINQGTFPYPPSGQLTNDADDIYYFEMAVRHSRYDPTGEFTKKFTYPPVVSKKNDEEENNYLTDMAWRHATGNPPNGSR